MSPYLAGILPVLVETVLKIFRRRNTEGVPEAPQPAKRVVVGKTRTVKSRKKR